MREQGSRWHRAVRRGTYATPIPYKRVGCMWFPIAFLGAITVIFFVLLVLAFVIVGLHFIL